MSLVCACLGGIAAGAMFYGGLWWTVRRLFTARYPAVVTFVSFWVRTLLALAAFLLLSRGRWENALAALAGFAAARLAASVFLGGKPRCT